MAKDLSRFLERVELPVADDEVGLRLDLFLVGKIFWRSRTDIQQRIKAGKVLVNEAPGKAGGKLQAGDHVVVLVGPEDLPEQSPESVRLELLYDNGDYSMVDAQAFHLLRAGQSTREVKLVRGKQSRMRFPQGIR